MEVYSIYAVKATMRCLECVCARTNLRFRCSNMAAVVVVLGFYVPPTAKVIRRRDMESTLIE